MKSFLEPWHLLLLILAGWINHRQQDAIEYLLDNRLIESGDEVACTTGEIACHERLGGMLRYYYRRAA
jgi:hypothetical protein